MRRMRFLRHIARNEKGATSIEYAFLAALVAVAIIASIREVGLELSLSFGSVNDELTRIDGGTGTTGGTTS